MRLEELKLWRERELLCEEIPKEYGFLGAIYGVFRDGTVDCATEFPSGFCNELQCAFGRLVSFLQGESEYFMRDHEHMREYCRNHPRARVPYKFGRESWGFRVLAEKYVWYVACTPWNDGRHFTVYCYDREILFFRLAKERSLAVECYGILPFTGERIHICFGREGYAVCSDEGDKPDDNKLVVMAQNGMLGVSRSQAAAMLGGALYGWDTPLADYNQYDENGYLKIPFTK